MRSLKTAQFKLTNFDNFVMINNKYIVCHLEAWINENLKGTFLSESTDVFAMTSNRRIFFLPETENLNFGDWKLLRNWESLKA